MLNRYVHHRQSQFALFSCHKVETGEAAKEDYTGEDDTSEDAKDCFDKDHCRPLLSGTRFDSSEGAVSMSPSDQSDSIAAVETYGSALQPRTPQQPIKQQRLRQVERSLRDSLNLSTVLGTAVVESAAFLKARQVSLLRYCPLSKSWHPVARYCCDQSLAWGQRLSPTGSEYPELMRQLVQGKAMLLENDRPTLTAEARQWLACWPGSWLLVPIKAAQTQRSSKSRDSAEHHWGILALARSPNSHWPVDEIAYAQSIALELSLAMKQAQQYESLLADNQELQKLALSDGLTQLANRRRFDEHLADEWQRLTRDQRPLSLILCDLDHFKRYNDTFGHPAGDRCLIRVARALLSGPQRPADLVARYGGEEFAIILPNTDTNGAWRIAQKIHNSIRDQKIAHAPDSERPYVTVTMGVSTIIPGKETTAQALVQAADLALYHAKQQGRDRTYVHAHYNTVNPDTVAAHQSDDSQSVALTPSAED